MSERRNSVIDVGFKVMNLTHKARPAVDRRPLAP